LTTTTDTPPAGAEATIDADSVAQLVARLRGICEDEHVLTHPHDLRTSNPTGCYSGLPSAPDREESGS
jgi:hypothetical protein